MKILMLNYEFPPIGGGAAPVTRELCRQLADRRPRGRCGHDAFSRPAALRRGRRLSRLADAGDPQAAEHLPHARDGQLSAGGDPAGDAAGEGKPIRCDPRPLYHPDRPAGVDAEPTIPDSAADHLPRQRCAGIQPGPVRADASADRPGMAFFCAPLPRCWSRRANPWPI